MFFDEHELVEGFTGVAGDGDGVGLLAGESGGPVIGGVGFGPVSDAVGVGPGITKDPGVRASDCLCAGFGLQVVRESVGVCHG